MIGVTLGSNSEYITALYNDSKNTFELVWESQFTVKQREWTVPHGLDPIQWRDPAVTFVAAAWQQHSTSPILSTK